MQLLALVNLYVAGIFLVLTTGSYIIYQCFLSPLARIPGPFWAKLTKLYRVYITIRGHSHRDYVALYRKYGNVVRIAPNEVSVADPVAFREIYRAGNKFIKSESYSIPQGSRTFDLVCQRNEKVHSEQRKLVARAYSMESMIHLEPKVDDVIVALVERLDELSGQIIDLGPWLEWFAFDVMGTVSWSQPFGFIKNRGDEGVIQRIQTSMKSIAWLMQAGWFLRLHQKLMPVIGNWLAANDRHGHFHQFASQQVLARKDRGGDEKDILGQLFTSQKTKPQLNDKDISYMMTTNVFAGSDTTSTSLRALFYLLLKNPTTYRRLMEDLEDKKAKGELSDPVTSEQAGSLPYLQAVIYEALRLYPAFGSPLDRNVPSGGMMINVHYIPEGTVVGTSAWVIHRVPEIWGPDVEEFCPERWLDRSNEGSLKRFFFSFGGGSRTCIGKNISWLEIEKLVPTLLMRYNIQLAENAELTEVCGGNVFIKGPKICLSPRQK